ncbi:uncharacterized protein MEPE_00505 [Melanopsichium pennsylvanicum]|uniref:Reverse transcriptase domain-containing protein n=1 Tax=Melanopsichium pennsylvanicum TaxID=63383 RepID=A0AAJ4XG18_9BASI|nr:uncharacterized protein MEPE_00505 [Melanopsichium pennsylvanicum]
MFRVQPSPRLPALSAQAPDDAMPLAQRESRLLLPPHHREEGNLAVSMPSHSGDPHRLQPAISSAAPPRSEPASAPPFLPGRHYSTTARPEPVSAPMFLPGRHIAPLRSAPSAAPPFLPGRLLNTTAQPELDSAPMFLPGRPTIQPRRSAPPAAPPFLPGWPTIAPPRHTLSSCPSPCPPVDTIANGIVDMPPDLAASALLPLVAGQQPPPPRPNTLCEQPIFDVSDVPATVGSLQLRFWSSFLDLYPDQAFATQLRGALRHGVKLGYDGPLRSSARLEVANLPMASDDVAHLRREIQARLEEGRLRHVADPGNINLVCSPVGVVPKPHSDKRRTIYHLSHPRKPGACLPSVNDGIHPSFVTIHYEGLDAIMDFIRKHPSASLWKADLEDAFRHVIVAESDARLMGIHFDGHYYQECALAFGGRSSPFLFNLFAEFLHWLASFALRSVSTSSTSHSDVAHYLDDFFGASDASANPAVPIHVLSLAAAALGFRISHKKTFWDTTKLEILGIELDSVAQTASITQERRQRILQLCSRIVDRGRASLLELQQVAGHLQFVTRVAPHGRAFLRRLYDAVKAHHKAPFGRRISKATRAELVWWINTLNSWDGVSLLQPSPLIIEHIWTDASKRSIGGHLGSMEAPLAVFSKELSRRHRQKDIRFLEALAVLEALRRFAPLWSGPRRVVIHVDNENVKFGLRKGSIRDPLTQVLFREIFALCLQQHIDLVPVRVSSEDNVLADALSRRRFASIQQQFPRAYSLLRVNRPVASSRLPASPPWPLSSSGTALPPAHVHDPSPCALTLPPSSPRFSALPTLSQPCRLRSSSGLRTTTGLGRHTTHSRETSSCSSPGTSTLVSPAPPLIPNGLSVSYEASSASLVLPSLSPSCPSPCRSYAGLCELSTPSAHPNMTDSCIEQPSALPSPAFCAPASSLGKRKVPMCSPLPPSPLPRTSPLLPSPSRQARRTLSGRASRSQPLPCPSARAQSRPSGSSALAAGPMIPSSRWKAANLSRVQPSSPYSDGASRLAKYRRSLTRVIPFAEELRPGRPQMELMPIPSVVSVDGGATVSVAMSTSPLPIAPPLQRQPSTPTPRPLCASTPSPGATSDIDCLSPWSLPAIALQPQLMTVSPCGMPLAHHVATAGSSQATLPS